MLSNNVIKIITSLGSKKYRQKYNFLVVEGVKNIGEVIKISIKNEILSKKVPNLNKF